LTVTEVSPGLAVTVVTFGGQPTLGGSVSLTVTVKLQVEVLVAASVAVTVTVVVPFGKIEPDGGLLTRLARVQLLPADSENITVAEHWPGAVDVTMLAGQVGLGASVSLTVTVC